MTLAVILLASMVWAPSPAEARPTAAQSTQTPATPDAGTPPTSQSTASQSPVPSKTPPSKTTAGGTRQTNSKKPRHKKTVISTNCDSASAAPTSSGSTSTPTASSAGPVSSAGTPTPCAPPKVIVRQGGSSEPSIQVAGGAGGEQASHQKDTANQMLDTTEANLKRIGDRQLSSDQQDMVNQIHQFMSQSKAAVEDGDLERARTLAWKAQLLSEELVKPEK